MSTDNQISHQIIKCHLENLTCFLHFLVYEESYFATVYEIEKNECLKYMNVSNCEEMQGIEPKSMENV